VLHGPAAGAQPLAYRRRILPFRPLGPPAVRYSQEARDTGAVTRDGGRNPQGLLGMRQRVGFQSLAHGQEQLGEAVRQLLLLLLVIQSLAHGHEQLGEVNAIVKTLPMPPPPIRLEYPALVTVPERMPDDIPQRQILPDLLQFLPCGLQQIGSQPGAQYKFVVLDIVLFAFTERFPIPLVQDSQYGVERVLFFLIHSRARIRTRDHLKRHGEPVASAVEARVLLLVIRVQFESLGMMAIEVMEMRQFVPSHASALAA